MWKVYAVLSALFAALTAIFAKVGVKDVNSDLAIAIRTSVILVLTWGIVLFGQHVSEIREVSKNTWLFLILSGVATGLSWLFYFKAIQLGDVAIFSYEAFGTPFPRPPAAHKDNTTDVLIEGKAYPHAYKAETERLGMYRTSLRIN